MGGERRGSATGIGAEGAGAALVAGDAGGRGGSFSPRMSTTKSSRVSVSRSSSAAATACSSSRFSVRVTFASSYASEITRATSASTSCAVRSDTSRRCCNSRPRKTSCSLSPTSTGPIASDNPHCDT